jgi:hypothetical protein
MKRKRAAETQRRQHACDAFDAFVHATPHDDRGDSQYHTRIQHHDAGIVQHPVIRRGGPGCVHPTKPAA